MSLIFNLSKFISVPILTEWLAKTDILLLDSAVANIDYRSVYLKLMNAYFNLFIDPESEMNLIEICGWILKFGVLSCRLNCLVRCRKYDWNMLNGRDGLVEAAKLVMANVRNLQCYFYNPLLMYADKVVDLCLIDLKGLSDDSFLVFCSLISLTIDQTCNVTDCVIIALLHQNPYLTSLFINKDVLSGPMLQCIAVHCTNLKRVNIGSGCCCFNHQKDLLIFAFHCRPSLSELPYKIPGYSDFVLKTLLWYKGAQLTQLTLDIVRALHNYELLNKCPHLYFCATSVPGPVRVDTNKLLHFINICRSYINGFDFIGLQEFSNQVKNGLMNSLNLSKFLTLDLTFCLGINIKWFPCLKILNLFGFLVTKEMFCSPGACQQLQSLSIWRCGMDIEVLLSFFTLPNLTEVTLESNILYNTDNFEDHYEIARNKISKLTLHLQEVSVDLFVAVMKRCSNLAQLSLKYCYEIKSKHLLSIIPYCSNMIIFTIVGVEIEDSVVDVFNTTCYRCELHNYE